MNVSQSGGRVAYSCVTAFVSLSACLSVSLFACLTVCLSLSVCLSVCEAELCVIMSEIMPTAMALPSVRL